MSKRHEPIRLTDLGCLWKNENEAVQISRVTALLDRVELGNLDAIRETLALDGSHIPVKRKAAVAESFYQASKAVLAEKQFGSARRFMSKSLELDGKNWLYQQRVALLNRIVEPGCFEWTLKTGETRAALQLRCPKDVCTCTTHLEIAECRKALESNFEHETFLCNPLGFDGVLVYTVGHYFAYTRRTRWTRWLKELKGSCRREFVEPLANILADVVYERTTVLKTADILVPVPPDPQKYEKRGFAPNDDMAMVLSGRFAMPVRKAILRRGSDTRRSSWEVLAEQFSVERSEVQHVASRNVLLVEDIWTKGRTIPICADKLREAGAKEVLAVALGDADF
jgi:predicted amidophosphoribosyltransferase